eukprot:s4384_g4.t1
MDAGYAGRTCTLPDDAWPEGHLARSSALTSKRCFMPACNVNVPFDEKRRCLKIALLGLGAIGACIIWPSWPSGGFVNSATSAPRGEIHSRASDLRVTLPAAAVLDLGSAPAEPPAVQILVPLLCAIIPVAYWWYVLVPFKRRELASSKRKGDMKEYLQDLATAPVQERKPEKWLFDKYLREAKLIEASETSGLPKAVQTVEAGLQQQLPGGGFWSFDNPIFVCLVMLLIFCATQVAMHSLST